MGAAQTRARAARFARPTTVVERATRGCLSATSSLAPRRRHITTTHRCDRPMMSGSMELVTAAWRSLMHTSSSSSSAVSAAAADMVVGHCILQQIQLTLAHAFHKHGTHALSPDEIAPIRALCDQLLPAHFHLSVPDAQTTQAPVTPRRKAARRVRYQHIWEDDKFSMGIFILPPGASIPLHDHPEMSVVSRVLYGELHVRSCDIVPSTATVGSDAPQHLLARMCDDELLVAPHTTDLLPDHGNLHEFVAGDAIGCAIFDILTPPYDPDDGRDCTYYRFVNDTVATTRSAAVEDDHDAAQYAALEVFDPIDFEVTSERYLGPPLSQLVPTPTTASTASLSSSRSSSGASSSGSSSGASSP